MLGRPRQSARAAREGVCRQGAGRASPLEVAEQVAEHEAKVTASIHNLYEIALKEKDYAAQVMLQWFISEQVEEEKNAADLVAKLRMIEERGTAVLMLDHRLAKRSGGGEEGEEE